MGKKDFSIRHEVEVMLEQFGVQMTDKQVDNVVEAIEMHDTFLGVIGLFVSKGIQEIAERDNLSFDKNKLEEQITKEKNNINFDEL